MDLKKVGRKEKANTGREFMVAFSNYRTWICMALYGWALSPAFSHLSSSTFCCCRRICCYEITCCWALRVLQQR